MKVLKVTILVVVFVLTGNTLAAEYDEVTVRKASEVLPAYLISGKNFQVLDEVTWNDGLHEFTVETEFGSFTVWGEPMLRVRLNEVDAWIDMEETSRLEAGVAAAGRQAVRSVGSLATAFMHPVRTITGVPTGIGRMFGKTAHDAENVARFVSQQKREHTAGKIEKPEGQGALARLGGKLVGVNTSYRRLAAAYGVNPYTTNDAIQEELLRLAQVDAPISVATKFAMPGLGVAGTIAKVSRAIYEESWYQIVGRNENALVNMGASPNQIRMLFNTEVINLTLLTLMIEILTSWEEADGRLNVIDQLILLETDAEAVFFAESLLIADWYNDHEVPIASVLPGTLIPVIQDANGKVVAFSALDYAYWTPDQEAQVKEFVAQYESYSGDREAWLVDQVSEYFESAVLELGWTVKSNLRGSVTPELPWSMSDEGERAEQD